MNPLIALQTIVDAIEKLHSQSTNTKQEIIRNEQALQALKAMVDTAIAPKAKEPQE